MRKNLTKNGFTLAEIIIVIGIIGVVAAITIPLLVSKFEEAQYKTAYKKVFSIASQINKELYMSNEYYETTQTEANFRLFKSKLKVAKECTNSNNVECWAEDGEQACTDSCGGGTGRPLPYLSAFIDNSGVAWSVYNPSESHILVDTNGMKPPNKYGRDRWFLQMSLAIRTGNLTPRPDSLTPSDMDCHYPPCYPTKWLYN